MNALPLLVTQTKSSSYLHWGLNRLDCLAFNHFLNFNLSEKYQFLENCKDTTSSLLEQQKSLDQKAWAETNTPRFNKAVPFHANPINQLCLTCIL